MNKTDNYVPKPPAASTPAQTPAPAEIVVAEAPAAETPPVETTEPPAKTE